MNLIRVRVKEELSSSIRLGLEELMMNLIRMRVREEPSSSTLLGFGLERNRHAEPD